MKVIRSILETMGSCHCCFYKVQLEKIEIERTEHEKKTTAANVKHYITHQHVIGKHA